MKSLPVRTILQIKSPQSGRINKLKAPRSERANGCRASSQDPERSPYQVVCPGCLSSTLLCLYWSPGLGEGVRRPQSQRSSLSSLWLRSDEKLRLEGVARCSVLLYTWRGRAHRWHSWRRTFYFLIFESFFVFSMFVTYSVKYNTL